MDVPLVEDEHVRGGLVGVVLYNRYGNGVVTRNPHRQACVVRLLGFIPCGHQGLCPWQHQGVEFARLQTALRLQVLDRSAADPHPVHQVHGPVRMPGDRALLRSGSPLGRDLSCFRTGLRRRRLHQQREERRVIADARRSFLTLPSPESAESANPREPTGRCRRRTLFLPSAFRTFLALTPLTPDLAKLPSTVTVSPISGSWPSTPV